MNEENPLDTKVTIFKNIRDSNHPHYVTVGNIFQRIKNGNSKELIERIRSLNTKEEQDELKLELPSICFSGIFSKRQNNAIQKHSGLICLDFDNLGERFEEIRNKIVSDRYTMACFTSPRNDGIKVIVKIPADINKHAAYLEGLKYYYNEDKSWDHLKDLARVCFESYDPNVYVNPNSDIFDIKIQPTNVVKEQVSQDEKINDPNEIYGRLKKWAEKTNSYYDGNKHNFLVYLSSACNRFGLPEDFTVDSLVRDYQTAASFVNYEDFVDIVKRVYISYKDQYNISHFDTTGNMNDFDPVGPARDVITVSDIEREMWNSYFYGEAKGTTTYFNKIDPHWTWKKGELTLMHGIGNHGKSTLMLQLMLIKSVYEGTKWGIFSPEQNPPTDFYKDIIHMYIGKTTEYYYKNQMTQEEYKRGMDFCREHFFFLFPKDETPTPQYINDRFEELIIKRGIEGCVIDPFNQLDNDYGYHKRDDIYISNFLTKEKRFALEHDVYKIIVAHPKSNLRKKDDGNYECPDVYDLAGGAMWNNKCDNILCTYRPFFSTDRQDTTVEFHSQKIKKQKLIGVPGEATLGFDRMSNRYLENGVSPLSPDHVVTEGEPTSLEDVKEESNDNINDILGENESENGTVNNDDNPF